MIVERIMRRDRTVVAAGLAAVVVLAWAYLVAGAGMDMSMPGMVMAPAEWSPAYGLLLFLMWWIMMIAMMTPGAAPMVLLYVTIQRRQAAAHPKLSTALFLTGYLVIWAAFGVLAALSQWGLDVAGLLSMDMSVANALLGGTILIAAGLYQFTAVKGRCLRHCQAPILFLSQYWRPGPAGAFRMGLSHGSYCVGCCWFLMTLLFFAGVMNLAWIAGLAIYVALEKLLPVGPWLCRAGGAALVVLGIAAVVAGVANS
jgi:predicted metal-binding membrane protein